LLYVAAAVPLLRLLAAPVAVGLFRLGEVGGDVRSRWTEQKQQLPTTAEICCSMHGMA
jgi:hypothetical protein